MGAEGIICAVLSAVFNGSFITPFKLEKMNDISPFLYQFYTTIGVFIFGLLCIPFMSYNDQILTDDDISTSFAISGLGTVSGIIFVIAIVFSFLAVDYIGVALGQGIWSGVACTVAYLWGVLIFKEVPANIGLSVSGIIILIIGVLIIAFCREIVIYLKDKFYSSDSSSSEITTPLVISTDFNNNNNNSNNNNDFNDIEKAKQNDDRTQSISNNISSEAFRKGVICACLVGLFGGSILAPMHYADKSEQGLIFLPSFGFGALITGASAYYLYNYTCEPENQEPLDFKALPYGILSGFLFNISNLLSIIAIPILGYGIAYPILQCAIFVSGVWGVFVFKEIQGTAIIRTFFGGGIILICGAIMLAIAQ